MKTITSSGEYHYKRVEVVLPTADVLAQYAGRYYSPELDVYWTLVAEADHLRGAITGLRVSGSRVRHLRFIKQSA